MIVHSFQLAILFAIFTFSFISINSVVLAHDIIDGPWLFVNNQNLLTYNKSLSNSQLVVAERSLKSSLEVESDYNFAVNTSAFAQKFNLTENQITAEWDLNNKDTYTGTNLNLSFDAPATYYLEVKVINADSQQELFADSLVFTVGEIIAIPDIQVGERTYRADSLGNKIIIPDSTPTTFQIVDPKSNYEYQWDLGGKGAVVSAPKVTIDPANGIPEYILVRSSKITGTTNPSYVDYYLIIENGQTNQIARPPANIDVFDQLVTHPTPSRLNLHIPMLSFGLASIAASLIGWVIYSRRRNL